MNAASIASLLLADSAVQDLGDLGITASAAELNFVDGVTSSIQTQLDGKQPLNAILTDLAGLTQAGNKIIYFDSATTAATSELTPFIRTLLSDVDGAEARTTLGVVIGTNVQAFDAFLDDIASLTDPGADRILFWDDSAGEITWLSMGTNVSISGTTLNVTGGGDVTGPVSSTDRAIATWNSTGGDTLRDTGVTIDASNNMTIPGTLKIQGGTPATNEIFLSDADGLGTWANGGELIGSSPDKGTIALSDRIPISDSEDGSLIKKVSFATIQSTLETAFDGTFEEAGAVAAHAALTTTHGVSGTIVGTSDSQLLTNKEYRLNSTLGTDDTFSGLSVSLTAAATTAQWEVAYVNSSSKMALADADAIATSSAIALATAAVSTDASGVYLLHGFARNDAWNWTPGGLLYLSTTAGAITQTAPSATDDVIQVLGVAITADIIYFKPNLAQVEHV